MARSPKKIIVKPKALYARISVKFYFLTYCENILLHFRCEKEENIAVIPVGYADGFIRSMGKSHVTTMDGKCFGTARTCLASVDLCHVRINPEQHLLKYHCTIYMKFN